MESITIVIKDQVGTRGFSVSRTRMVPPTKNIDEFTTAEFRALNNFVDTEKEGLAHLAEEKATAMTGQEAGAPVCPICGAATKISSSRKTWVCTKAKWRKVGDEWVNSGCNGSVKV